MVCIICRFSFSLRKKQTELNEEKHKKISREAGRVWQILGEDLFKQIKDASLSLYKMGAKKASECGIILADTKFEFGTDESGKVYLIDEVLTPDSSRYWPADKYEIGRSQPSYDKQYVRDWLETLDWNKQAPGPVLPDEVVANTIKCYSTALSLLMK